MNYEERWEIIEALGEGGQGKVFRARDKKKHDVEGDIGPRIRKAIGELSATVRGPGDSNRGFAEFRTAVLDLLEAEHTSNHGALKVLHEPKDARSPEQGAQRIADEMRLMSEVEHPNVLRILDADEDGKWFVSQFHPAGTLAEHLSEFQGDFPRALRAFHPLVAAVATLHDRKIVHRDIKPQNIFLGSGENLVLGDFGIVFFQDRAHTRITETFENVGSRDWMPIWAQGMRIKEIEPQFDVFSLGKVLWSMVSGLPILQGWYFSDPDYPKFDVTKLFPNAKAIHLANALLQKCVVERKKQCLPNAGALLQEVDRVLSVCENSGDLLDREVKRSCKVCGIGHYCLTVDRDGTATRNFGLQPGGMRSLKIFTCDNCGNVQLFAFAGREEPPAWSEKPRRTT